VAVIDDGKIAWVRGYGVSRIGGPAVTPQTLFQAASISKPVSAVAVMQLVEAGKLDLDRDVNELLKSWKMPPSEQAAAERVTIRRLLSHTAGLTVHGFPGYAAGEPLPNLRQMLDGIAPANNPPIRIDLIPGTRSRYSGGGYLVLQQLVEDATGMHFSQVMRERVLQPLGMKHSNFYHPLPPQLLSQAAGAYLRDGRSVEGGPHVYPELAAAGLWTTPSDLARYAIGIQQAWAGNPGAILSSATVRKMMTREIDRHGLGPVIGGEPSRQFFTHGGANFGFRCQLAAYLEGDGAVIMTNGDNGGELAERLLRSIAREYQWPDFAPPERVMTAVDPQTFDRYAGAYRFESGTVITVWRDGEQRYSRVKGAPVTELFATSEREYFQKALPARFEFFADAGPDGIALILHESFQRRTAKRLPAAESQPLLDEALAVGKRVREQRPAPGSEAALRKLFTGIASGVPDYDAMAPPLADTTRQQIQRLQGELKTFGDVRDVTFTRVTPSGADVYDARFENGAARAEISLEADGRIGSAWFERTPGPTAKNPVLRDELLAQLVQDQKINDVQPGWFTLAEQ
jgi:CubicO group peptidase (beta-lactamase class C family)